MTSSSAILSIMDLIVTISINDTQHNITHSVIIAVFFLSVAFFIVMLNVITLSVVMVNVVMLSVVMLSIIMLNVITRSVAMLNAITLSVAMLNVMAS
jgi:hypothetical protein